MRRGYTMIEIVIVVFVVGFILAAIISAYANSLDRQRLNEATEGIIALGQKARSATIASLDNSGGQGGRYGLHFDLNSGSPANQVVMFRGDIYNGGTAVETYKLPVGILLTGALTGQAGTDITNFFFKRITGEVEVKQSNGSFVDLCVNLFCGWITIQSQGSGILRALAISQTGILQ